MGCTSDEPYLSLDKAFNRIYDRTINKDLKNISTDRNTPKQNILIGKNNPKQNVTKQNDLQEFDLLFKTNYEFKYDKFDKLLGKFDWDTYIDNIYEERKNYLQEVNIITTNIINTNTIKSNFDQKLVEIEQNLKSPINPINNKERNVAYIKLLIDIYNLIVSRAKKTYIKEFIKRLINITNKQNKIETINISSDEEDIIEVSNDENNFIDIDNWTFQYQDTRMFGIDTEESIIKNKDTNEYLKWIKMEIENTDNKEYILSLILQQAYIIFKPNNVLTSISFGIEIYKILHNTIFEDYIEDIIAFYTNFNLDQILSLIDYEIFKNNKLNDWLTKEIDKHKLIQKVIRISISTDTYNKDTKEENSEESSEKITEAK
jgi:hypothetical protein